MLAAFPDPLRLARWWGPNGFTNTFHRISFQPGGERIHDMRGSDVPRSNEENLDRLETELSHPPDP